MAWSFLPDNSLLNILLLIGIALISYDIHELKALRSALTTKSTDVSNVSTVAGPRNRIAWIDGPGDKPLSTYMLHIYEVFVMAGYEIITGPQRENVEWDVMWIHQYTMNKPEYRFHIDRSRPWQLINHVPGSGFYTSKVSLATTELSSGVPKAFQLPKEKEQFLKYAEENQDLLWVQKDNTHRNIKIRSMSELDLDKENSFVQRFIENPLLIDNRKFDIGIYTVITSLQPLRVYLFDGDALLRFCAHDYEPFDDKDVDKYVVGDDYTPIWEIPSLKPFYNDQRLGWRDAFDSYLQSKDIDSMPIWKQIGATIAEVFQRKQSSMLALQKASPFLGQFFELSRFDFVVDDQLKVYLMEANMSPNLSSGHFRQNQILYEQVVMNVLSLIGATSQLTKEADEALRSRVASQNPLVSDRDLRIPLKQCWDGSCSSCTTNIVCELCGHCLSEETSSLLRRTYLEHINKRRMTRVVFDYEHIQPLSKEDHLLRIWLEAKCHHDNSWC